MQLILMLDFHINLLQYGNLKGCIASLSLLFVRQLKGGGMRIKMESRGKRNNLITDMEVIVERLSEVLNLMDTVYLGLKKEKLEKQALDCIMCIRYNMENICVLAEEIMHNDTNNKDEMKHE